MASEASLGRAWDRQPIVPQSVAPISTKPALRSTVGTGGRPAFPARHGLEVQPRPVLNWELTVSRWRAILTCTGVMIDEYTDGNLRSGRRRRACTEKRKIRTDAHGGRPGQWGHWHLRR